MRTNHQGSAYLMIIGAMVICLFALLYSLKSSMQARHSQARLQDRFQVQNLSQACMEACYNQLKISQLKESAIKKEAQIKILDGICRYEILKNQNPIFTVRSVGEIRGMTHERTQVFRAQLRPGPRQSTKVIWSRREVNKSDY
ncbi:MAG: hypothetical protein H3C47_09810 [Candidatus Cloacimonetes bacterium]|nr:hypothetical protein [Candidatus Cloacimonadota bacterium]